MIMQCEICGAEGARVQHVSRSYGKGETLLVIENVPTVSCPHCGERYLTADTLRAIERLKRNRRSTVKRSVAVAEFE